MALAHTVASAVERAYRRGRALEKRRELMPARRTFLIRYRYHVRLVSAYRSRTNT